LNPGMFDYIIFGVIVVGAVISIVLVFALIIKTIQRTTGMFNGKSRKTKEKAPKQPKKQKPETAAPAAPPKNKDFCVEYEITYIQSQERIDPDDL